MADIASTDLTYVLQAGTAKSDAADPRFRGTFSIAFGNSTLTYPSGGIPLTKAKLGCPANIDSLSIVDSGNANGYTYKYDRANAKIRIYQAPAQTHAHDFLVKGGTAAASTDALNIKSTVIGKEAATDATNLAADVATKGGVQSATLAAAALAEVASGSFAPAATTLYVSVVGY